MDKLMLAPFAKVNVTDDGGREVWGFATLERKDKSNEIADFDGTLDAFKTWSSEIEKNTQGKSKGNVRIMHQPVTGGSVIDWQPGETTVVEDGIEKTVKGIWVGSYVPPHKEDVIADIDSGILSAYSIGGSYAKKWLDPNEGAVRFIPKMSELSLVDNPAVPGAEFQLVKADIGPWNNMQKKEYLSDTEAAKELIEYLEDGESPEEAWNLISNRVDLDYGEVLNFIGKLKTELGDDWESSLCNEAKEYLNANCDEDNKIFKAVTNSSLLKGGEGHYENTKIVPPNNQLEKGSEEIVTAEQLAKAAQAAGISVEQMSALFTELAKAETPAVTTVDGDGDKDNNKEFPNPDENATPEGQAESGEKQNEEGIKKDDMEEGAKDNGVAKSDNQEELAKAHMSGSYEELQSMLRSAVNNGWNWRWIVATFPDHVIVEDCDADKFFNVPYTVENGSVKLGDAVEVEQDFKPVEKSMQSVLNSLQLQKSGASISEANREKLHKAAAHIHNTCSCDKCMKAASIYAGPDGTNNGEEVQEPITKAVVSDLQKAVGFSFAEELQKAGFVKADDLQKFQSEVSEVAKSVLAVGTTLESVNKSVESVDKRVEEFAKSADERLKAIEEAPVSGGPLLFGATGDNGGTLTKSTPLSSEYEVLNKAFETTTDPNIKDVLGRKLAVLERKNIR